MNLIRVCNNLYHECPHILMFSTLKVIFVKVNKSRARRRGEN